jgi:hypothetical protein
MQVLLNDFTSPSTPAFAVAILAWNGIPNFTATVLNNRIDGLVPFFKTGRYFLNRFTAQLR